MPEWLQILIAVVGLCGTAFGIIGFTAYINERMKHKAHKKNLAEDKSEEEMENLKHQAHLQELSQIIVKANEPLMVEITNIGEEIGKIRKDLSLNTKGTVTILRNDMKKSLDFHKQHGFASAGDKANWMELYNTYRELGGNHFQEYVDQWKKEIEALPTAKKQPRKKLTESE